MNGKDYAEAVGKYDRNTRDALAHLESVLGTPEAAVAGWELSTRKSSPSLPERITDMPLAHPVVEEPKTQEAQPTRGGYVHKHKWERSFRETFEERMQAVPRETIEKMNRDLAMLNMRRREAHAPRMSWDDVLMVQAGKPAKQNRRKGNGKGRAPLSLEALRERELNGKHLD